MFGVILEHLRKILAACNLSIAATADVQKRRQPSLAILSPFSALAFAPRPLSTCIFIFMGVGALLAASLHSRAALILLGHACELGRERGSAAAECYLRHWTGVKYLSCTSCVPLAHHRRE